MNPLKNFLLLFCMIIFITSTANADTLDYQGKDEFLIDIYFKDPGGTIHYPGVNAGKMTIDLSGYSASAFCIELGIAAGSGDVTTENPDGYWSEYGNNGLYATWLMDQFNPAFGYNAGVSDSIAYAALQIAIWETIYDFNGSTHDGSSTGNFGQDTNYYQSPDELSAWSLAATYNGLLEAEVSGGQALTFDSEYEFFIADFTPGENVHGGGQQELLVARPVPEPATMLLFGIGLLGITAVGRRKI